MSTDLPKIKLTTSEYMNSLSPEMHEEFCKMEGETFGDIMDNHRKKFFPNVEIIDLEESPRLEGAYLIDYDDGKQVEWVYPNYPPLKLVT